MSGICTCICLFSVSFEDILFAKNIIIIIAHI